MTPSKQRKAGTTVSKLKVVKESDKPEDYSSYDGYGEYPQGYEFDMWRVYELEGENRFFKMTGRGDSYGSVTWDVEKELMEVFPKEKTVTVYDFEGE